MADNRVYLRLKRGSADPIFDYPVMAPLKKFGGVLFPYTPVVQHVQQVSWQQNALTHTNYAPQVYGRTENPKININEAKFTATTEEDAQYLLGVLFFFKYITKMHFGKKDGKAGTPPPVLEFSAYGQSQYNNVPVVIASVNYQYPNDIDYVRVQPEFSGTGQEELVPIVMSLSIDMLVQYNVKDIRDNFNLNDFASGQLAKKGYI